MAGVGAGGVLARTGFMVSGFLWAGIILLALGVLLASLAYARERSLRRRLALSA